MPSSTTTARPAARASSWAPADAGSLGPGWHHAEPSPGGADGRGGLRWSMAECWFYLQGDAAWSALEMRLSPQPRDTWAELWLDGLCVGRLAVPKDQPNVLRWQSAAPVPAGQLVECRVLCGVFVPAREGMGADARELGLHVAEIACA